MTALPLLALLASMPTPADLEPPAAALTGPSSTRLALPVTIRFDDTLTDDVSSLVKKDTGRAEGASREPVWAVARYAAAIARRHFEQASWGTKNAERTLVVKNVSVGWTEGPSYEVKVVIDRYDGDHRVGQATGSGWGNPDRSGQRAGAAWAGPFGGIVHANANQAKADEDGVTLRTATVAAIDSAMMQLGMVWAGEQLGAKMRADAEVMMRKAQDDYQASQKKAAKK